jgi:transcriptional regulator with XRE-family HTH domain
MSRALRDARVRSGLTTTDAAEKIGVHFVTVYAWENENRTDQPSEQNLLRAARAYGTTSEALNQRAKVIEQELGTTQPASSADGTLSQGGRNAKRSPRQLTPRSNNGSATNASRTKKAAGGRNGKSAAANGASRARPMNHASVTLSSQAYARILRVLADLSEDLSLAPSTVGAAQHALTAPGLFDVFAAFTGGPLTDDDILRTIDAASIAVRSFISSGSPSVAKR